MLHTVYFTWVNHCLAQHEILFRTSVYVRTLSKRCSTGCGRNLTAQRF